MAEFAKIVDFRRSTTLMFIMTKFVRTEYYIRKKDENDPKRYLSQIAIARSMYDEIETLTLTWGSNPHVFGNRSQAERSLQKILISKIINKNDVPPCEVVEQKFISDEEKTIDVELTPHAAIMAKAKHCLPRNLYLAFSNSLQHVQCKVYWTHVIRRSGGKKLIEDQFENRAYTNGMYSFFQNTDDVMVAKLLLGDYFREIIDLTYIVSVVDEL